MADLGGTEEVVTPLAPFVTIAIVDGKEQLSTNLPPVARPMVLWLLERGKLIVLTQHSEQEKSKELVKPNGNLPAFLRSLRKR